MMMMIIVSKSSPTQVSKRNIKGRVRIWCWLWSLRRAPIHIILFVTVEAPSTPSKNIVEVGWLAFNVDYTPFHESLANCEGYFNCDPIRASERGMWHHVTGTFLWLRHIRDPKDQAAVCWPKVICCHPTQIQINIHRWNIAVFGDS